MSNPWLAVPLEEYEGHMNAPGVEQLAALAELFKHALAYSLPESVAILGVAGGNGLEFIDPSLTRRIVGVDINQAYLQAVQQRFGTLPGIEFHCCDLSQSELSLDPVSLVHAALIFEHAGLGLALTNALSLLAPGGKFSAVLQLPGTMGDAVARTRYQSMQILRENFELIDIGRFQQLLAARGFQLIEQQHRPVSAGKALWLGIFTKSI